MKSFFCFVHLIFRFLFWVTFGDEVTKVRNYYVIFVYNWQGKMEKNQKENRATKVTKIPKNKRQKYGMNEAYHEILIITVKYLTNEFEPFARNI